MHIASWQGIVRARRAAVVRRQLTSQVLHRAGLNYFMRAGMARRFPLPLSLPLPTFIRGWRDALFVRALRRIRATAPRTAARLHNRYPAYTCVSLHEHTPVYGARREKKKRSACAFERDYSIYSRGWNIRVIRWPVEKPNWLTWYKDRYKRTDR